jgi:integrase
VASIEERQRKNGTTAYRVKFRLGGSRTGPQQTETFDTMKAARRFKAEVDACDQQWPHGWVPGIGRQQRGDIQSAVPGPPVAPADPAPPPGLLEWGHQYVRDLTDVSPYTRERNKRQITALDRQLSDVLGGPVTVLNIETVHIRRWVNLRQGVSSAKTIANQHGLLAQMFKELQAIGLRADNPCARVRLPRRDPAGAGKRHLSWGEFGLLADAMHTPGDEESVGSAGDRRFLETLVGTGLRFSEATALYVSDLDLEAALPTLQVVRAHKRNAARNSEFHLDGAGGTYEGPPKTRRSVRTVVLTPAMADILREQIRGKRPEDRLFTAPRGGQIHQPTFTADRWQPAITLAQSRGLPRRPRMQDLRHTHSAWCSSGGVPVEEIQNRHGHESITTTVGIYGGRTNGAWDNLPAAIDPGLRPTG